MRPGGPPATLLVMALVAAGCAGPAPTPAAIAAPTPAATASPTLTPSPQPTPPPTSQPSTTPRPPSPGAFAPIDPELLDVLPDEVDGLPVEPAPDALIEAVGNPAIVRNVKALAAAAVVDPATLEFAYATVMRFFDGVMSDPFYRDWRISFDAGVCEVAGGVSGNAEAEIGGRQVFIGSCADGIHTYHAWLGNRGVLVSVSAVGVQRLGEQLVEDLRD